MSSTLFEVQKAATAAARGSEEDGGSSSEGALEPVGLFNLAVNPQSFTQTVENLFDLSFLVKQGHASLTLDCHGLLWVCRKWRWAPAAATPTQPPTNGAPKWCEMCSFPLVCCLIFICISTAIRCFYDTCFVVHLSSSSKTSPHHIMLSPSYFPIY